MEVLRNWQERYDLVVIGGGINGAAIARDAALRQLKAVLFEKMDFGAGTSTKTTKLIHGGLRYLEQLQFSLVKESLIERSLLLKNAPHLVKPLSFLFPVYSTDPRPLWQIRLGLCLYDFLGGKKDLPKHQCVSVQKIFEDFPGLKSQGLNGGCVYYDAQMLDNRMLIETVLSAENAGADVHNHMAVIALIKNQNQIIGVKVAHLLTGEVQNIYGKVVVNATGAWSGSIAGMEPGVEHEIPVLTKGVHLIIPQITSQMAFILRAPQDGRLFFIIPWEEYSLVGTTDTFFDGPVDEISIDFDDCKYLLTALNAFFPEKFFTESSIISSFVGLRPLVASDKRKRPSDFAREHVIHVSKGGLVTILGGKYTTHRKIAEEVVDTILSLRPDITAYPCKTKGESLPGASGPYSLSEIKHKLTTAGLSSAVIDHLMKTYGTLSLNILEIIQESPLEAEQICLGHPHIFAEVTYGVKFEYVKTVADWFLRRTTIPYTPCQGRECVNRVAAKLAVLLDWTEEKAAEEELLYLTIPGKIGCKVR